MKRAVTIYYARVRRGPAMYEAGLTTNGFRIDVISPAWLRDHTTFHRYIRNLNRIGVHVRLIEIPGVR